MPVGGVGGVQQSYHVLRLAVHTRDADVVECLTTYLPVWCAVVFATLAVNAREAEMILLMMQTRKADDILLLMHIREDDVVGCFTTYVPVGACGGLTTCYCYWCYSGC
jgi:hypothetical protein